MNLYRANIENLIAFWTACGIRDRKAGAVLTESEHWPRRFWFEYGYQPDRSELELLMSRVVRADVSSLIPQWHEQDELMRTTLLEAGFEIGLTQEAMVASSAQLAMHPNSELKMRAVTDAESAAEWTRIASESFGYPIDNPVVAGLIGVPGFQLVLAQAGNETVGTGMLAETEGTAGLHMVGVPPAHRRRGYARQIMFGLFERVRELGSEVVTLQASTAGEHLYRQLGFEAQGSIASYRPAEARGSRGSARPRTASKVQDEPPTPTLLGRS